MAKAKVVKGREIRLARYDGAQWSLHQMEETDEGTLREKHGRYELSADVAVPLAPDLYVVAVDEVTLRSEADFHATRRRIVFRSLFTNSGDLMELAKNITIFTCLIVAVLLWFQLGQLASQVAHADAAINTMNGLVKGLLK